MRREVVGISPRAVALSTFLRALDEEEAVRAKQILAAAANELQGMRIRVRRKYVQPRGKESVPQRILREAREERADLIVAGNEGRGALKQWVLGSVAQRLISAADRPITLVPARGGREPKQRNRKRRLLRTSPER
jgi:nucleotide-binding universal stress UspA family protein